MANPVTVVERFPRRVEQCLRALLGKDAKPGILAVSGGADSVALLRALASVWPEPLHIAHVNHQLRGADADADAAFVAALCPAWPHHQHTVDVAAVAQATGTNLEATARTIRYEYFATLAQQLGASWVATAHTLDDQAETVLHRLLRGTSLRGLRGIAGQRELAPGVRLLRPILTETRATVTAYLQALGQPWREDASNTDPAYTRNRLRHELLPVLRTYNPAVAGVLGHLAEQANEIFTDIEATVMLLQQQAECPKAGAVCVFKVSVLVTVPAYRLRELFHVVWEREGWSRDQMTFALWQRAAAVGAGTLPAWDFPDGVRMERRGSVVLVGQRHEM